MKFSEYNEERRIGLRTFPIEYYYLSKEHYQYIMPPHWHKEFEIVRVLSGELCLYINNDEHILKVGDIAFLNGEALHRGVPDDCVYECLVFDISMLDKRLYEISALQNGSCEIESIIKKESSALTADIDRLFGVMKKAEEHYELKVFSLLFAIFHRLSTEGYILSVSVRHHAGKQTRHIIDMLSWIEEHFSEPIDLERLSKTFCVSGKHICRIFKDYTSKSPMRYINELRIDCACHEMTAKNRSVTQAAYDCGFNDSGYFARVFKKYKGMTPGEYKKRFSNK